MLQKIKTALQSPYAAPITEPVKLVWKWMSWQGNSLKKDIETILHDKSNKTLLQKIFEQPELSLSMGTGGLFYVVASIMATIGAMAGESAVGITATQGILGIMAFAPVGVAVMAASPFVLSAATGIAGGIAAALLAPLMSAYGCAKIIDHLRHKPAPQQSSAIPISPIKPHREKNALDLVAEMSSEQRQALLSGIKEKFTQDFDAVAYPKKTATLQEDLVVKPSPFVKK